VNITLETVRDTVRSAFGRESFVATFIQNVVQDEAIPTACIDASGCMKYNPAFVKRHVVGREELFCLIAHELMHPLFSHFVHGPGPIENLAADTVINAMVSLAYAKPSRDGCLFRRYYPPRGIEALLRPGSATRGSRYENLYWRFYGMGGALSTGETVTALKVLTPVSEAREVRLLGGHGQEAGQQAGFAKEVLARIAEDLRGSAQEPCSQQGHGQAVYELLIDILRTHVPLRRTLLERFATDSKVDAFRCETRRSRTSLSPLPLQPSKRDFVLLGADIPPFHYHNARPRVETRKRGLAVYLDVSGSVNQHLPSIISVLRSLKDDLRTILLFSNRVVEVPFAKLLRGHVDTTYGTDFDCIAEHIAEMRYDKAVILTDGYASMTDEHLALLQERRVHTLTVLFGGRKECEEFAQTGPVIQLEDIVRNR
jgi:hypothetical protein